MSRQKQTNASVRSDTVTVRLDPKLRYIAELAGRHQDRTLSSFIEWSVRRVLTSFATLIDEPSPGTIPSTPLPLWMEGLWDVDEAERFFRLARSHEGLLSIPEQRLWKLFRLHMAHTSREVAIAAFREFWNSPSINTSHLQEGGE